MSLLARDLAAIFADTSLTVSAKLYVSGQAPQSARGFLTSEDVPEPDSYGGITLVKRTVLTVQEGVLPGLASDLEIDVDGVTYTIHGPPRSGGRGKVKLYLVK